MENSTDGSFAINTSVPTVIYGAAAAGLRGHRSLKVLNHYNVVGFFDKRANEIEVQCGLPVWGPDAELPYQQEELLVVICVKNVFEHENIAKLLIESGYRHLIFLPLRSLRGGVENDYAAINRNYQRIFNDVEPEARYELEPIPCLYSMEIYDYRDYAVLKRTEEAVVVNVPLSAIYIQTTASFELLHNDALLCSVFVLVPHIDLFRLFSGSGGNAVAYIEFCMAGARNSEAMYGKDEGRIAVTDGWRKNVIRNRRMVFDVMTNSMETNYGFFIDHAPACQLLSDNCLLMKSAKHRAAFFIVKGRTYMPVTISNDDYTKFLNMEVLTELKTFLLTKRIYEFNAPVQHPYLYNYPSQRPNYYELFVHKVVYHIARLFSESGNTAKISVEDSLLDNGALSRCLARVGFQVTRVLDNDEDKALCVLLDRLFYVTSIEYKNLFKGADIVCCLNSDLDRLESVKCSRVLFVLSENGKEPVVPGFGAIELLFKTIWNGHEVAGYMLENQQQEG